MAQHIFTGIGAPSFAPTKLGQHYIETSTGTSYISTGTSSTADWKPSSALSNEQIQDAVGPMFAGTYPITATYNDALNTVQITLTEAGLNHNNLMNVGTNSHFTIDNHIGSLTNPHNVTKLQVGLGNCDNTSDANKPISNATQTALNAKENTIFAGGTSQYWRGRSDFLTEQFTWNKEQIYNNDYPETWFLSARSYPKDADADAIGRSLSGLHSEYPFVLLDEIGDMPIQVGKKAEQIFTGGTLDGLVLAAGNPTSTSGLLYDVAVNQRENWDLITITADPDDPKRTPRVDIEHARQMIKTYGRNDPWVQATILGEFPASGLNQLLTIDEVDHAMRRKHHLHDYENAQKRLGIDVARLGMDSTVIFPRQGLQAFQPVEMRGARNPEIAARVALAKSRWNSEVEFVDGTGGFGAGVVDALMQSGYYPQEIHFSSKAEDSRFYNKRSEMWFRMAEWVKRGGSLPANDRLRKELSTPLYSFKNGKFILEEKDQLKKRLGYSTAKIPKSFVLKLRRATL